MSLVPGVRRSIVGDWLFEALERRVHDLKLTVEMDKGQARLES